MPELYPACAFPINAIGLPFFMPPEPLRMIAPRESRPACCTACELSSDKLGVKRVRVASCFAIQAASLSTG